MDQLALPFALNMDDLTEFLDKYIALEEELGRIKEEMRDCKALYKDAMPLRAILTAVKVVRAREKLAQHPKEGLAVEHQGILEALVTQHISVHASALRALIDEAIQP